MTRVHTFEAAPILKLLCNLQLLVSIVCPEFFGAEAYVYRASSMLAALAHAIPSVFPAVYLKQWSTLLRGNGEDDLATKCLVGFWTELCYLLFVSVLLVLLVAIALLR